VTTWPCLAATEAGLTVSGSAEELRLEARDVPLDRVLEELGALLNFSVSARCAAAGCPTLSGRMQGPPERVLAWLLTGHNHAILYHDGAPPEAGSDAETGIARVVLLAPGKVPGLAGPDETRPDRKSSSKPGPPAVWRSGPDASPFAAPSDAKLRARVLAALALDPAPLLAEGPLGEERAGGPFVVEPASMRPDGGLDALLRALPLIAPLARYRPTSGFGPRQDPFNGRPARHEGLDLAAPPGAPVRAAAPGIVLAAGWRGQYGRLVEIDHGFGIRTRYGHLSRISVAPGRRLAAGESLGIVGRSGRAKGRHLHYEVLLKGTPVDPASFLEAGRIAAQG
jgi:hypothetical protein